MEQTTKEVLEYEFVAGVDCGNYETEVAFYNENGEINYRNAPSAIKFSTVKHPEIELSEKELMKNLYNHLNIHFISKNNKIRVNGFYSIGQSAINSQGDIREMGIISNDKSSDDLPVIMSTTLIAATVLKEHYDKFKKLPEELNVNSFISTAIPSSEYKPEKAKAMEERLKGVHSIEFYLGKSIVSVNVNIQFVKCTEEGKTSMLAFTSFDNGVLDEYNKEYEKNATIKDFKNVESFHIDIGDGTTEFTFIEGINPSASAGIREGVGHATLDAINAYSDALNGNIGDLNRHDFMKILRGNKSRTPLAKDCFNLAVKGRSDKLFISIRNHFISLTKGNAEYFFVHGGGSCVFKEDLYKNLVEYAKSISIEVVYIPCNYATHMNSTGNLVLVKALTKK